MEFTLEQSFASAVCYVQDRLNEGTKLYFDDMPENFFVPSVYFPVPRTSGKKVTFDTYLMTIYFEAWFMASKDWLSEAAAAVVRDNLLLDNCRIDSVNRDGTSTGKIFRVTDVETQNVETGITKLIFGIQHYFSKEQDDENRIHKVNTIVVRKTETAYSAWLKATEEYRKEEVNVKCLEKTVKIL